jgi:hypothetical protein
MLKRILVAAVMALAGCQTLALPHAPDENAVHPASTPDTTWIETVTNGVRLGMWMPDDWIADTHGGLMLAEPTPSSEDEGVDVTVVVNLFVPRLDYFIIPEDSEENVALAVLEQVVDMPSAIGDNVITTEPSSFDWNGHDAAYYLLTAHDGANTIVIAVEVTADKLVMCNVSMPEAEAHRVRQMLPQLLQGFTVNEEEMNGEALNVLPDPLTFPVFAPSPSETETAPVVQ